MSLPKWATSIGLTEIPSWCAFECECKDCTCVQTVTINVVEEDRESWNAGKLTDGAWSTFCDSCMVVVGEDIE